MRKVAILVFFTALFLFAAAWYGGGLQAQESERYGVLLVPDLSTFQFPEPLFPAMSQAGIRWAKAQFDRELIHLGPGQFDWTKTDEMVAQAAAHGIQLLGELGASPLWDTTAPGPEDYYTYPPADYDQWADYVFQTVSRYKDFVRYWEVWNEEDQTPPQGFWSGTPAEYARLLAVAYREVKRADSTAQVLICGFLAISGSVSFFQQIMADPDNPADQNFDIMSIHGYFTAQEARDKVIFWRSMTSKPLWVTEMGFPADPQLQTFDPEFCCSGAEAQARFLQTVMPDLANLGAEKVFWFALWVPENPWPEFDSHGLLDRSFTPRQAYFALRDLLGSSPPPTASLSVSPTSIPVGGTITATWSGIATPTPNDWIGLYLQGTGDFELIDWIHVSCSQTPGSAHAAGSCPFVVPLSAGTYELRLFANESLTRLATSNAFTFTE